MESSNNENSEVIMSGEAEGDSIKARLGHGLSERTLLPTTKRQRVKVQRVDETINVVSGEHV
jgi:hypothetical protein